MSGAGAVPVTVGAAAESAELVRLTEAAGWFRLSETDTAAVLGGARVHLTLEGPAFDHHHGHHHHHRSDDSATSSDSEDDTDDSEIDESQVSRWPERGAEQRFPRRVGG